MNAVKIDAKDHLGLVGHVAKRFINLHKGQKIEDTEEFSDGLIGLTRAIQGFDESRGFQFSTFAYYCIRNEICKGIKERSRSVQAPIKIHWWEDSELELTAKADTPRPFVAAEELLRGLLNRLPVEKETDRKNKKILIDYFLRGRGLKEIGEELGVTKERVRQRREKAMRDLRNMVRETV